MISEEELLRMSYELLAHRGFQTNDQTPLMQFFHHHSSYVKDRTDAQQEEVMRGSMGRQGR